MNENEEVKNAIYSSSYITNRDFFHAFSSINYNRIKKMFLVGFCIIILDAIFNISDRGYDIEGISIIIPICLFVVYLKTNSLVKQNYERYCFSAGKESVANELLYEDRIVSSMDGQKREYYYHQITQFFESKNLLLLHLKHQLYIIINKETLNADVDEVKAFLIEKCSKARNKKFINCSNDQSWCLILLIGTISFYAIGAIVSIILDIKMKLPGMFML